MFNGKGKYYKKCGTILEGFWSEGKLNGRGKSIFQSSFLGKEIHSNGTKYEGEFIDGIK